VTGEGNKWNCVVNGRDVAHEGKEKKHGKRNMHFMFRRRGYQAHVAGLLGK
jgi:hypothetical protein